MRRRVIAYLIQHIGIREFQRSGSIISKRFECYKINTITAFTFSDNVASIKVLEKVGVSYYLKNLWKIKESQNIINIIFRKLYCRER